VVRVGRRRGRRARPLGAAAARLAAHERVELRRTDHGQQRLRGRHVHHGREHGHVGAGYGGRHEREPRVQLHAAAAAFAAVVVVVFFGRGRRSRSRSRRRRGRQHAQIQTVPRGHVPASQNEIDTINNNG